MRGHISASDPRRRQGSDDGTIDPAQNLARDEELLAAGRPAARVARFSAPAVSLGVADDEQGPVARRARGLGLPVLRRRSGGTGLLHLPGDVVWSVVVPRSDPGAARGLTRAYDALGAGVVDGLRELGVRAAWSPPVGASATYCLLSDRGRVLTVDGRVLGGAAQHLTSRALLHHGVLTARLDPGLLGEIFGVPRSTIADRLTALEGHGLGGSGAGLAAAVLRALAPG